MKHQQGRIEVICGCMFSGKSEELIRRMRRAQIARQKIQLFKPRIDDRYGQDINSHDGRAAQAIAIDRPQEILENLAPDTTVVGIDEGQFFDHGLVDICRQLTRCDIRVIVTGLDLDFRGEPFGPMPELIAQAEQVDKLHAICVVCGDEASRTQRLIDGKPASFQDPIILVGATEAYEARCRRCHEVPGQPDKE
ncbi:MAG: thymidine kinase [Desulfobacteraceae bacterium]|nr:MAG: thymidine kinase [Desulfobacteraceae bacterium]